MPAAPPCRTLTAAWLDRDADLDRDLGAVATALHHDAGLPADQAIARAGAAFRGYRGRVSGDLARP